MVDGRVDVGPEDLLAGRREALAEHLAAAVVPEECEQRGAIGLGERLTEGDERRGEVRRNVERVRECWQAACGHVPRVRLAFPPKWT